MGKKISFNTKKGGVKATVSGGTFASYVWGSGSYVCVRSAYVWGSAKTKNW